MKQIQQIYLIGLSVLSGFGQLLADRSVELITCQQLREEMESAGMRPYSLRVINVLPKAVCADCHIPGSINIPYHLLARRVKNWAKDSNIVIYCVGLNCPLARYACELLKELGFWRVRLFDGGLRTWKKESLPTMGRCTAGYLWC